MLTILVPILVLAIVLLVIWWVLSLFLQDGRIQKIIGVICALIILIYTLDKFGYRF